MRIGERSVDFYESRGRVLAIAVDGTLELALLIESSAEGQSWLQARQFRLFDDGFALLDITGGARGTARVRCS